MSSTTPSITFLPHEIIRTRDARADAPKARRLNEDMKSPINAAKSEAAVMNDVSSAVYQNLSADDIRVAQESQRLLR